MEVWNSLADSHEPRQSSTSVWASDAALDVLFCSKYSEVTKTRQTCEGCLLSDLVPRLTVLSLRYYKISSGERSHCELDFVSGKPLPGRGRPRVRVAGSLSRRCRTLAAAVLCLLNLLQNPSTRSSAFPILVPSEPASQHMLGYVIKHISPVSGVNLAF